MALITVNWTHERERITDLRKVSVPQSSEGTLTAWKKYSISLKSHFLWDAPTEILKVKDGGRKRDLSGCNPVKMCQIHEHRILTIETNSRTNLVRVNTVNFVELRLDVFQKGRLHGTSWDTFFHWECSLPFLPRPVPRSTRFSSRQSTILLQLFERSLEFFFACKKFI